jgi:O-acetyl-ADP-ribose deacetylase
MAQTGPSDMMTLSLHYQMQRRGIPPLDTATLQKANPTFNDKISIIRRDITTLDVDAIVNAANTSLLGGGGVDGAIHRAAGPALVDECETLDGCATGSAKMTDGYELPAKKVIHAVGPVYWSTKPKGTHSQLLAACYRKSLELAVEHGLKTIAFPALSTGAYGYPSEDACKVALQTVRSFLDEGKGDTLDRIIFCNFLEKDQMAYYKIFP